MKKNSLVAGLVVLAGAVALAGAAATQWSLGGIVWTSAPVLLGIAPLALVRSRSRLVRCAAIAFATTATILLASFYAAWSLGLMAGGAATPIPVFVFAPFYSLGAASVVSFAVTVFAVVREYRLYRRSTHSSR